MLLILLMKTMDEAKVSGQNLNELFQNLQKQIDEKETIDKYGGSDS